MNACDDRRRLHFVEEYIYIYVIRYQPSSEQHHHSGVYILCEERVLLLHHIKANLFCVLYRQKEQPSAYIQMMIIRLFCSGLCINFERSLSTSGWPHMLYIDRVSSLDPFCTHTHKVIRILSV